MKNKHSFVEKNMWSSSVQWVLIDLMIEGILCVLISLFCDQIKLEEAYQPTQNHTDKTILTDIDPNKK